MAILTTGSIDVKLEKGQRKFRQTTTKNVDASKKVEQPKELKKPQSVSTRDIMDVGDAIEKKRRDDIMAQRKAYLAAPDGAELKKLNMRFVFVDMFCEDLIQCIPRREFNGRKNKKK